MLRVIWFLVVVLGLAGCMNHPQEWREAAGEIVGAVVKGPVTEATVTATVVDGTEIGTATTDDDGSFRIAAGTASGNIRVCGSGGSYIEEEIGTIVELEQTKLCAIAPEVELGQEIVNAPVTVWSHWVSTKTDYLVSEGRDFGEAYRQARGEVLDYIGCAHPGMDLLGVVPADPVVGSDDASALTAELLLGILNGGLSYQGKLISKKLGITPGILFTSATLVEAAERDIASDGLADGLVDGKRLEVQGYPIQPEHYLGGPRGFAQGVRRFLESDRNNTGFRPNDLAELLQCLASNDSELFVGDGEGLDVDGPVIEITTPGHESVVSGTVEVPVPVEATVTDASPIVDCWFGEQQGLNETGKVLNGTTAALTGALVTTELVDLDVTLVVSCEDAARNLATEQITVQVNNDAPTIDVQIHGSVDGNGVLSGAVTIVATSEDPHGVTTLTLTAPEDAAIKCEPEGAETTVMTLTCNWDTQTLPDAAYQLDIATSDGTHAADRAVPVVLDNYVGRQVCGLVALESPLTNAVVTAHAAPDLQTGDVLVQTVSGTEGLFCLDIPDTYSGPVLLKASGTSASYLALTGPTLHFGPEHALLAILDYRPALKTDPNPEIADIQINGATTLASHFSVHGVFDLADPVERAWELVSEHLSGNSSSFDLTKTRPSNFMAGDVLADSPASQALGLFHVALARLGASKAVTSGLNVTALPSHELVRLLGLDLGNGVLDGLDSALDPVHFFGAAGETLRRDSLRFDAAQAAAHWLDGRQPIQGVQPNITGLTRDNFANVLWRMTTNASQLFGGPTDLIPDFDGPTINFLEPSDGTVISSATTIRLVATDLSSIASLAFISGLTGTAQLNGTLADLSEVLDPAGMADGTYTITAAAADVLGNTSTASLAVVLDTGAPVIALLSPSEGAELSGATTLHASATDPQGVTDISILEPAGLTCTFVEAAGETTCPWDTTGYSEVNGPATIKVSATDSLGHQGERTFNVVLVNHVATPVKGFVDLEAPLRGATIQAFAFPDLSVGVLLAQGVSDAQGAYELLLPPTYAGYVLVTASGNNAALYQSAVSGFDVSFVPGDNLATILSYGPSLGPQPTPLVDVQIHAATAMAAHLAPLLFTPPNTPTESVETAFELVGEHLNRSDPIDIRRVRPTNMLGSVPTGSDARDRSGLFAAALARLGAELGIAEGGAIVPSHKLVQKLLFDLDDTKFNGQNANGPVFATDTSITQLTGESLRYDSAMAGFRWLSNEPLGGYAGQNDTGLQPDDFANPGGFLMGMATNNSVLFDGSSATLPDFVAPVIVFTSPVDGAVIAADITIQANASDPSNVVSFAFTGGLVGTTVLNGTTATLTGDWTISGVMDGPQVVSAVAVDGHRNEATQSITFSLDTTPPTLVIESPTDGALVEGDVEIRITAQDLNGVATIELLEPEADCSLASGTLTCPWDSLGAAPIDGETVIRATATDNLGNSIEVERRVNRTNYEPVIRAGTVTFGTPVRGAKLRAYVLHPDRTVGSQIATTDSAFDGAFSIELPDTYAGWVLLEAVDPPGSQKAQYRSLVNGQDVEFGPAHRMASIIEHAPSTTGDQQPDTHINGATTAATRRVLASTAPLADAVDDAFFLLGDHLNRSVAIDIRRERPSDLLQDATADGPDSQRLALYDAGFHWLGAKIADELSDPVSAYPGIEILGFAERDLGNTVFDGIDGDAYPVQTETILLHANFWRYEHAKAIWQYLTDPSNVSGIYVAPLEGPGSFLWQMAENTSALFAQPGEDGYLPPESFDQEGPTILFTAPPTTPPRRGAGLEIYAEATDPSGIQSITLAINGAPPATIGPDLDNDAGILRVMVNTILLGDGSHSAELVALDTLGNSRTQSFVLATDNTPPSFTPIPQPGDFRDSVTIEVHATDQDAVAEIETALDGAQLETYPAPTLPLNVTVDGFGAPGRPCNVLSTLTVTATDPAGNERSVDVELRCDNQPPLLSLETSRYISESLGDVTYAADGSGPIYQISGQVNLQDFTWDGSETIQKFFNRFDGNAANIPTIKFSVRDDDAGDVDTPAIDLSVSYKYFVDTIQRRGTTAVSLTPDGTKVVGAIPISYQSLSSHLATEATNAIHRIEVQVKDLAGNVTTRNYKFRVAAYVPPLWRGNCGIHPTLQRYKLSDQTLHEIFEVRTETPVFRGDVRYDLDLAPGSAVAGGEVILTLSDLEVSMDVTHTAMRLVRASWDSTNLCGTPSLPDCFTKPTGQLICHDTDPVPCECGGGPNDEFRTSQPPDSPSCVSGWFSSSDTEHNADAQVANGTYKLRVDGFEIAPDSVLGGILKFGLTLAEAEHGANLVRWINDPEYIVNGSVYQWPLDTPYRLANQVQLGWELDHYSGDDNVRKSRVVNGVAQISRFEFAWGPMALQARYELPDGRTFPISLYNAGGCDDAFSYTTAY